MVASTPSTLAPELLTCRQASQLCGLSERTLARLSQAGAMPRPVKLGTGRNSAVRYSRRELLAWIDAGCPRIDGGPGNE